MEHFSVDYNDLKKRMTEMTLHNQKLEEEILRSL